ncbi:MAG: hypothetical protein H8E34_02125 [Bacteroidetes bacterium]|nr:hypothetical protein [Bacteroidota bacterium]MBL6944031.1 hypothetical protein [Bacteroidales bacterium]
MKALIKVLILILTISFSLTYSSCSRKSHGFNYKSDPKSGATSYDPVVTKHKPIRKKFILNNKRKTILGHSKPPRSN